MIRLQLILFFFLFTMWGATAHNAMAGDPAPPDTLRGTITDRETGDPIGYAYLYLEEINRTITAHGDGTFAFSNIPAGVYTLRATRIGYRTLSQSVQVEADGVTEINISLQPTVLTTNVVEVVGQREQSSASLEHASKKISGTDLRQNLGTTLASTLSEVPGLSQRSMGAAPARPVIRGLGGERVLMLQDGERTGDVSGQSADHAVTVDPIAAEEIEIARGPAALIYGSNAIGGVINVVRNQISATMPEHLHGTATLQGESVNTGGVAAVEAELPIGSFAIRADANYRAAGNTETPEGTLENSDFNSTNNALGISYVRPWGYAGIATSMYLNNYGIPPDPEGGHANGVDIEMEKYQFDGATEIYLPNSSFRSITADFSYKYYFHREIESSGITGTEFGLLSGTASVKAHHPRMGIFSEGTLGLWAETRDYAVNGANTPDSDAHNLAAFAVEEINVGRLHLESGLRFDYNQTLPAEEDPSSSIGHIRERSFAALASSATAIYDIGSGFFSGATFMHSFRAPSQEELYSEGPHLASYSYEVGNPDLDPERGLGKELFVRYKTSVATAELTGYHNAFSNYIYPRNTGEPSTRYPSLNVYQFSGVEAILQGFEFSSQVQLLNRWALSGSVSYTHARREISEEQQQLSGEEDDWQPLPMIPPLKGTVSLKYGTQGFQSGLQTRWAAKQDRTGDFETPTDGYLVFDLYGQYRFDVGGTLHTVSLNFDNILDKTYRSHLSRIKELVPEPGRNISLLYRIYF